jgi:hypothetical protein
MLSDIGWEDGYIYIEERKAGENQEPDQGTRRTGSEGWRGCIRAVFLRLGAGLVGKLPPGNGSVWKYILLNINCVRASRFHMCLCDFN